MRDMGRTNVAFQSGSGCFEVRLATASRTVLIIVAVATICPSEVIAVAIIIVAIPTFRSRAVTVVATEIRQDFVRRQVDVVHAVRVNLSKKG